MLKLLLAFAVLFAGLFGFTNMTKIEDAYYDVTEAAKETTQEVSAKATTKVNNRMNKFVKEAKDSYDNATSNINDQIDKSVEDY